VNASVKTEISSIFEGSVGDEFLKKTKIVCTIGPVSLARARPRKQGHSLQEVWRKEIYAVADNFPFKPGKSLFSPLTFASLFARRFRTSDDFKLLPYTYVFVILQRLQFWKTSATERVFLV